jgi:hypothetical protein
VGEPWHLTLDEIKRLTRRQVRAIYFARRDEKGRVEIGDLLPEKTATFEDQLRVIMRGRGWPEHKIDERIALMRAEQI